MKHSFERFVFTCGREGSALFICFFMNLLDDQMTFHDYFPELSKKTFCRHSDSYRLLQLPFLIFVIHPLLARPAASEIIWYKLIRA